MSKKVKSYTVYFLIVQFPKTNRRGNLPAFSLSLYVKDTNCWLRKQRFEKRNRFSNVATQFFFYTWKHWLNSRFWTSEDTNRTPGLFRSCPKCGWLEQIQTERAPTLAAVDSLPGCPQVWYILYGRCPIRLDWV